MSFFLNKWSIIFFFLIICCNILRFRGVNVLSWIAQMLIGFEIVHLMFNILFIHAPFPIVLVIWCLVAMLDLLYHWKVKMFCVVKRIIENLFSPCTCLRGTQKRKKEKTASRRSTLNQWVQLKFLFLECDYKTCLYFAKPMFFCFF